MSISTDYLADYEALNTVKVTRCPFSPAVAYLAAGREILEMSLQGFTMFAHRVKRKLSLRRRNERVARRTGFSVERLERRDLLAGNEILGLGIAGDSLSDEYLHEDYNYARTWDELLAQVRAVNLGPQNNITIGDADDRGEPRREGGYAYNWARAGARSDTLLDDGQDVGLAGQISAGQVSHAVLAIGQNDFSPERPIYAAIYDGTISEEDIQTYIDGVVNNIDHALATLDATEGYLAMSNIADYGVAPLTRFLFPNGAQRELVTNAISATNARIAELANGHQIPLVKIFELSKTFLGTNDAPTMGQTVGGNLITNTATSQAAPDSHDAFVHDGIHPATVLQGYLANVYLEAFRQAYGVTVERFSEEEIVTAAGLPFTGDTFPINYGDYLSLPAASTTIGNSVWLDANQDGIRNPNEREGVKGVTIELFAVGPDGLPATADDVLFGTATSDGAGLYQFQNVAASNYFLKVSDLPANRIFTLKNQGTNGALDSDVDPALSGIPFTAEAGESNMQLDVGLAVGTPPPTVSLSLDDADISEDSGIATITATLSSVQNQDVVITLGFSGSAANPDDYTRSGTQITIPANSLTGKITLTAVQDSIDEANEPIIIDITAVTNGTELGSQQVTTTITDDDAPPSVTLSINNASIAEGGGTAIVTAALSAVSSFNVTADLAFSGSATNPNDYTRSGTQITIPANSLTGTITLTAVQDTLDEPNERITVDITRVSNGTESGVQQVTTVIVDDDVSNTPPTISDILDKTIKQSTSTGAITFTIGDSESAVADLTVTGSSSNTNLVPNGNIAFGGSSESRTLVVTPTKHRSGSSTITVRVSDGTNSVSDTFELTVTRNPSTWQNPIMPLSVDGDLVIAPIDALLIINELNVPTVRAADGRLPDVPPDGYAPSWFDVNGDFFASPLDVLLVINELNDPSTAEGEFREVLFAASQMTSLPSTNSITIEAESSTGEATTRSAIESNSAQQSRIQERRRLAMTKSQLESVLLEEILDGIAEDIARQW